MVDKVTCHRGDSNWQNLLNSRGLTIIHCVSSVLITMVYAMLASSPGPGLGDEADAMPVDSLMPRPFYIYRTPRLANRLVTSYTLLVLMTKRGCGNSLSGHDPTGLELPSLRVT